MISTNSIGYLNFNLNAPGEVVHNVKFSLIDGNFDPSQANGAY